MWISRIVSFLALAALTGCAGATVMRTSPEALATEAKASVDRGPNSNSRVKVDIKHLAKPEKFSSSAKSFVLWVQPVGEPGVGASAAAQNVGAFNVTDELKADIETVTPHKNFDLFVTAEKSREAVFPSGSKILWAQLKQ